MHVVRPDGRRLAAYDARPRGAADEGPVVIFLHGNAGNLATRAPLLGDFVLGTRCRVLAIDWSGFGGNEGSPSEREVWRGMMEETYRQFVDKAAAARKLDVEKLAPLAEGRVWSGRQAKENGLVDDLGVLADAIAAAKKAGGLGEDEQAELLILPEPRNFFDTLLEGGSLLGAPLASAAPLEPLGDLAVLSRLFREPAVVMLPYRVTLR